MFFLVPVRIQLCHEYIAERTSVIGAVAQSVSRHSMVQGQEQHQMPRDETVHVTQVHITLLGWHPVGMTHMNLCCHNQLPFS